MRKPVKTHLPAVSSPLEWATIADGILYTAQIPNREDGSIETGDIRAQAELTLSNLRRTVEAAGGSMDDICRVDVYVRNMEHFEKIHKVRREYFSSPPPASTMVEITKMTSPEYLIEINAIAVIAD